MGKEKQVQSLVDGTEINTSKDGWEPKSVSGIPALMAGWKEGAASHHSIGLGLALACKDNEELAKEVYLGDFAGEKENGDIVEVPVFDPVKINNLMYEAFVEKYELDVPVLRIAGNRTGAKKELESLKAGILDDPKVAELLKESNPELYAKLGGK